jgi:predicted methyltransferase
VNSQMRIITLLLLIITAMISDTSFANDDYLDGIYQAAVSNPDRSSSERSMDNSRKPLEILPFIGIEPGMTVMDMGAGGGYTTMLAARVVGEEGRVYAQGLNGRSKLDNVIALPSHPLFKLRSVAFDAGIDGSQVDIITMFFTLHDMYLDSNIDIGRLYRDLYTLLKPGGVLVILDNNGIDGSGISHTRSTHRIDRQFIIDELAGTKFQFAGESQVLRNDDDDPNRPWNQYSPAGFHDRFAIKFRKPE